MYKKSQKYCEVIIFCFSSVFIFFEDNSRVQVLLELN